MTRQLKLHSESRPHRYIVAYTRWLDDHFGEIIGGSLLVLINGMWAAVPTVAAIGRGTHLTAPVIMTVRNSSFSLPLIWMCVLTVLTVFVPLALIVSCIALWRGWLQLPRADENHTIPGPKRL